MMNIQKIKPSGIFTNYIFKSIPLAFDESLSYYEVLCGILDKLKTQEEVINNNADLLAELESYVKNYFDNLDVQEEINNKLDEMAQDGTLENLISQYIELQTTYTYNNVNEMKQATNLSNGSFTRTSGYYEYNDGGGAYYKIRNVANNDDIDEMFIIALADTSLVAELIVNDELNIKQIGVKGLINTDDTLKIQKACDKEYNLYFPKGEYYLNTQLVIFNATNRIIRGDGIQNTIFKISNNQTGSHTSYITTSSFEENIHNFNIKDLSINCGTQNVNRYGLSLLTINNLNLENIEIYNNKGYATRFNDSNDIYANNLYIHDCNEPVRGDGVAGGFYGQNMKNVQINNTKIINCGDHAFYLSGDGNNENSYAENIELNNVYCKNIGSDGYTAGGSYTIYGNITNVTLNNCIVEQGRQGIHISKHGDTVLTPRNITINNCVLKNLVNDGIYIEGNTDNPCNDITITNTIIDTTEVQDGISIRLANNVIVSNNIIKNIKRIGIEIVNSNNNIITNNIMRDNTNHIWCGTRSSTSCNRNIISNNSIYNTSEFFDDSNSGIYVSDICTNTITSLNDIDNCKAYNYNIRGASNISVLQSKNNTTNSLKRKIIYGISAPSSNIDSEVGDICLNTNASAGGNIGWVCIVAGTPGTWKAFGTIAN